MDSARHLHHQGSALAGMLEERAAGLQETAGGGVLHRVVRKAVRRLAYLINRHDIRMLETRRRFGFTTESRDDVIGIVLVGQHASERHYSAGVRFPRLVNYPHPA